MAELINSLKTLAYGGGGGNPTIASRRSSTGQLRMIPLLNLGRNDSSADSSFTQWRDAMRMVSRLPGGLPPEFRLRLWENLSDRHLQDNGISWARVMAKCRVTNSRDVEIADQIEKDLHRTGCTGFEKGKQAMLKRVLVSYSRWNPSVGYCQGFNMIGAMLLQMTSGDETLTLKVFIFLVEGVLPHGYFSNGLRGLAVDMAVFREILKLRKPTLHNHLIELQDGDENPPLTDVFTMHWFLTLFIHCLPTTNVLRIWDLVFLEGSEVLLRTALVLWTAIEPRILTVSSADEFYSVMGVVTREMLEFGLLEPNALVKCVVSVGPFPFPGLAELRQQQRAIIQQDTPYKSFFLAKRELDNLKRHYTAIKDRQRATTIILKGLEASRVRVPGQRSNSLVVASTAIRRHVQNAGSKPKIRRASSGSKSGGFSNNNNNRNINTGNLNNKANNSSNSVAGSVTAGTGKQVTMTWDKAAPKLRSKSFRRRRTASQSSGHTTDSSSSTELCDSNSSHNDSSDDSEGVWSETDNRWKKPKPHKKSESPGSVSLKSNKSNLSLCPLPKQEENPEEESNLCSSGITRMNADGIVVVDGNINYDDSNLPQLEVHGVNDEEIELSEREPSPLGNSSDIVCCEDEDDRNKLNRDIAGHRSKILDTNNSQHFLEEMSRLGKSDSFYENLSKRICELQFQNLKILSSCNTTVDPKSMLLPEFERSPVPSPIYPCSPKSFGTTAAATSSGGSKDDISLSEGTCKPNFTPKEFLSPKGSISSVSEISPLRSTCNSPHIPLSHSQIDIETRSRRSSYSRRASSGQSSQSVSEMDVPDIRVDAPEIYSDISSIESRYTKKVVIAEQTNSVSSSSAALEWNHRLNDDNEEDGKEVVLETGSFATVASTEVESEQSSDTNNRKEDEISPSPLPPYSPKCPKKGSELTLDLFSVRRNTLPTDLYPVKPFTPLKTPDFLQLNPLVESSKETNTAFFPSGKNVDLKSCLVSPVFSPSLTETSVADGGTKKKGSTSFFNKSPSKENNGIPPRPKKFPVNPEGGGDFLLAFPTEEREESSGATFENTEGTTPFSVEGGVVNKVEDDDEFVVKSGGGGFCTHSEGGVASIFPTTACPCQCQTTEEINAVIRQNIAILQRLKLKPAFEEDGSEEDDEYEDIVDNEPSILSLENSTKKLGHATTSSNKYVDISDQDSGCFSKRSILTKANSCSDYSSGRNSREKLKGSTDSVEDSSSFIYQDSSGCSSGGGSTSTISTLYTTPNQQHSVGSSNSRATCTVVTTTAQSGVVRRKSSGKPVRRKSLTRSSSAGSAKSLMMASGSSTASSSSTNGGGNSKTKQKKVFNPFPTTRRSRI